jgi:hypothetical protein
MSACGARDQGAAAMARLICTAVCLQSVSLRDSGVTSKGAGALAAALWCNPATTHVNLTNNEIDDGGCVIFLEYLRMNQHSLSALVLELNPISTGNTRMSGN